MGKVIQVRQDTFDQKSFITQKKKLHAKRGEMTSRMQFSRNYMNERIKSRFKNINTSPDFQKNQDGTKKIRSNE